jgi:hypothetical protein
MLKQQYGVIVACCLQTLSSMNSGVGLLLANTLIIEFGRWAAAAAA